MFALEQHIVRKNVYFNFLDCAFSFAVIGSTSPGNPNGDNN